MDISAPTLVDLFCGAGGFSLGAELAGFSCLAAVDVDPVLQSGYRRNFTGVRAVQGDVAQIDAAAWREILDGHRPDGVIGGPPCQGFSRIGRRRKDDPRNTLVHKFYAQVAILRPAFFVMENVEGILDEENAPVLESAIATVAGLYDIAGPFVVDASACGAATVRRRVIVVGTDPARMDRLRADDFIPDAVAKTTVRDAIADLPGPLEASGMRRDLGFAAYPPRRRISAYAKQMRRPPPAGLGDPDVVARLRRGEVSGLAGTRHDPEIVDRYRAVVPGRVEAVGKSYRLKWDGHCPTLRAGTGMEKGAFQAVRPLHPEEPRVITVREAARLQGFPDWFALHTAKWHSFRMIGNSVSPVLSQFLMGRIATRLGAAAAA